MDINEALQYLDNAIDLLERFKEFGVYKDSAHHLKKKFVDGETHIRQVRDVIVEEFLAPPLIPTRLRQVESSPPPRGGD